MGLDRVDGQVQLPPDLAARQASRQQGEHGLLARGQGVPRGAGLPRCHQALLKGRQPRLQGLRAVRQRPQQLRRLGEQRPRIGVVPGGGHLLRQPELRLDGHPHAGGAPGAAAERAGELRARLGRPPLAGMDGADGGVCQRGAGNLAKAAPGEQLACQGRQLLRPRGRARVQGQQGHDGQGQQAGQRKARVCEQDLPQRLAGLPRLAAEVEVPAVHGLRERPPGGGGGGAARQP
jgi:hypothetical protein